MNGAIRTLVIEIYDTSVETWAQGRYLVHGHNDSLWTDDFDEGDLEKGGSLFWMSELDEMIFAFSDYEPEYKGGWVVGGGHGKKTDDGYIFDMQRTDPEEWDRYKEERCC